MKSRSEQRKELGRMLASMEELQEFSQSKTVDSMVQTLNEEIDYLDKLRRWRLATLFGLLLLILTGITTLMPDGC